MLTRLATTDTRAPKLLRHYKTPWGNFKPGYVLEANGEKEEMPWTLADWELDDAEIDEHPDWFEWTYFCGQCGDEVCLDAEQHTDCADCHGHWADTVKPVVEAPTTGCRNSRHYIVLGTGVAIQCGFFDGCAGYPVWDSEDKANAYAYEMTRLAADFRKRFGG
jgi:hypothetical protein